MHKQNALVAAMLLSQALFSSSPGHALPFPPSVNGRATSNPDVVQIFVRRGGGRHGGGFHAGRFHRGAAYRRAGGWHGGGGAGRWGGWARPGRYWWGAGGAIAAGAAIGFVGAATAVAWAGAAPGPGLCWFYTDASRTNGFWDACP